MAIHRWLDFKVTSRCNNLQPKCRYCSVPTLPVDAPETLSLAVIHQTLLDARAMGFDVFWLLGGEPSVRTDADHLVDPLRSERDIQLTVVTNGVSPNWSLYESIFQTAASRAMVQVSLDSLQADNFKHVDPNHTVALIDRLQVLAQSRSRPDHECAVEVHAVLSRQNLHEFDSFITSFAQKGIGVSTAMVCPWQIVSTPVRFNEFTSAEAMSIARRLRVTTTGQGVDRANALTAKFIERVAHGQPLREGHLCGAGLTHLVINGDGEVHRCIADSFCKPHGYGNVTHQRLHEILKNMETGGRCAVGTECFDAFVWDHLAFPDNSP